MNQAVGTVQIQMTRHLEKVRELQTSLNNVMAAAAKFEKCYFQNDLGEGKG